MADTNTIISGLLWQGPPRRVLDAAQTSAIELFSSETLLAELEDVLSRDKFSRHLTRVSATPHETVLRFAAVAQIVEPATISPVVHADADDDAVLACARAAQADVIVSGDHHLLELRTYENIEIITATELLMRITPPSLPS